MVLNPNNGPLINQLSFILVVCSKNVLKRISVGKRKRPLLYTINRVRTIYTRISIYVDQTAISVFACIAFKIFVYIQLYKD